MTLKLTLDAMIKRADFFEKNSEEGQNQSPSARKLSSINFDSLKPDSNFVLSLRKPDFQRETNQWSVDQTLGFIQSFVEGYFVPSVILWQSTDGYVFVIDGAHRLSDLPQNWWTPIIRSIETVEVFYENEEKVYGRVQG